jgi:hypothetical protein
LLRSVPALAAALATVSAPLAAAPINVHCTIVDAAGGAPLAVRCKLVDAAGVKYYPPPAVSLYHPASGGYFYANGSFTCSAPAGPLTLTLRRGFEYHEVSLPLHLTSDTSFAVALERFVSMDGLGWFSGDAHVHINHGGGSYVLGPPEALLMARAEGLNIVNCLDNSYYFTGAPASCSLPDCVVFMSEEMRSSSYGHFGFLGMASLAQPVSSLWWPLAMDMADSAHARSGAIVVAAHPAPSDDFEQVEAWPGSGIARELPVDCISRRVDAVDVMSYSNFRNSGIDFDLWYRLLNCGFRLPASAGTDAAGNRLDSNPFGGFRVYVSLGDDVFTARRWFEGLAAGRTFVTNGPLITRFEIDGRASGDSCVFAHPGAIVSGRISLVSAYPVDRVDVVRNGAVALTVRFDPPRASADTTFSLAVNESAWIAARVVGVKRGWIVPGDSLVAHTSPVYCAVAGLPILLREDAAYLAQWVEDLELLVRAKGSWPDPAQSARVFGELAAARNWFETRAGGSLSDAEGAIPNAPPAVSCVNSPNPFSGVTAIDIEVSGGSGAAGSGGAAVSGRSPVRVDLAVFDVSGRLVRRLLSGRLVAGRSRIEWDGRDEGGREVPSGIYFARLAAAGDSYNRKMILIR